VEISKVEASREDARRKAELKDMKLNVKEVKATKDLLAEEREIMMMPTKHMNEQ
jgi:hypothetical protein